MDDVDARSLMRGEGPDEPEPEAKSQQAAEGSWEYWDERLGLWFKGAAAGAGSLVADVLRLDSEMVLEKDQKGNTQRVYKEHLGVFDWVKETVTVAGQTCRIDPKAVKAAILGAKK